MSPGIMNENIYIYIYTHVRNIRGIFYIAVKQGGG